MKKLKSIAIILGSFFILTAFVKTTGNLENLSEEKTNEIIEVINKAHYKEESEKLENKQNLLIGKRGIYKFKNTEIVNENNKDILYLTIDFTNRTDSKVLPDFSFYLDTKIEQVENNTTTSLDLVKENLNEINKKVNPNETVSIQIPIELNSKEGKVLIKDIYTNGVDFTKTIEL